MNVYMARAEWAPKPDYLLSDREKKDHRALLAYQVYKNITAGIESVDIPSIKADEVLLRVGACGVCGSDISVLKADTQGYTTYGGHLRFPVVLGHEFSGEVVEVGKAVTTVQKGDLVAAEQIRWCGACRTCRAGLFNQCLNLEETGLSCDGAFAEYVVLPEKYCCVINDIAEGLGNKMDALEMGALAEPTCVAYNGIQVAGGGLKPGSHFVVFGAGPIGLAGIMLAKAMGAARIIAFNTNPARDCLAVAMGADTVLNPKVLRQQGTSPGQQVMELTRGIGAGMVMEASGNIGQVLPDIMECLAPGARIVQLGVGHSDAGFNINPLMWKNAVISGSIGHAGSDIFPSVLRMMAAGRIDPRKMITARHSLDNTQTGMDAFAHREAGHGKILISARY